LRHGTEFYRLSKAGGNTDPDVAPSITEEVKKRRGAEKVVLTPLFDSQVRVFAGPNG